MAYAAGTAQGLFAAAAGFVSLVAVSTIPACISNVPVANGVNLQMVRQAAYPTG
jgi:hypothetical protein